MAGAGWRRFQPGEVLTATNLQTYGIDQSVQVYPNSGARGSAIGSAVSEGMVSYLSDINSVEFYDGSNWNYLNPSGRVIQTVSVPTSTQVTFTGSSFQSTGLSASITPRFATSKILVLVTQQFRAIRAGNDAGMGIKLLRGATSLFTDNGVYQGGYVYAQGATAVEINQRYGINYLDSPATTTSTTYTVQAGCTTSGGTLTFQTANTISTITLMEISA